MSHVRKKTWKKSDGSFTHAFELTYTDRDQIRQTKLFRTKRDADAEKARVDHEILEKTHVSRRSSRTVIEGLRAWIVHMEELQKAGKRERSTVDKYRSHVEYHISKTQLASLILCEVSAENIQDFIEYIEVNLSDVMAKKVYLSLKIGLKYCRKRRWLRVLPTEDCKLETSDRESGRKVEIPTKKDIQRLLETADMDITGFDGAVVRILAHAGLRPSEMRGLPRHNFFGDLKRTFIKIDQRADTYNALGIPKSKAGFREIPIGPDTVRAVKKNLLSRKAGRRGLVFPGLDGEVMNYSWFVHQWWPQLMLKAGLATIERVKYKCRPDQPKNVIKAKFHPYALRHVAASLWIEMGVQPKQLQTLMGHSSIKITMDTYGHLWVDADRDMEIAIRAEQAFAHPRNVGSPPA